MWPNPVYGARCTFQPCIFQGHFSGWNLAIHLWKLQYFASGTLYLHAVKQSEFTATSLCCQSSLVCTQQTFCLMYWHTFDSVFLTNTDPNEKNVCGTRDVQRYMRPNAEHNSGAKYSALSEKWDGIAASIFHVPNLLLLDLVHAVLKVILLAVLLLLGLYIIHLRLTLDTRDLHRHNWLCNLTCIFNLLSKCV